VERDGAVASLASTRSARDGVRLALGIAWVALTGFVLGAFAAALRARTRRMPTSQFRRCWNVRPKPIPGI
jgi:hypothetical protein